MKGKTKSILGVALTLMLMVSLLCWAAPVSAKDLKWGTEDIPDTDGKVIQVDTDVLDLAVAADGETIYAAASSLATAANLTASTGNDAAWSTNQSVSGGSSAVLTHAGGTLKRAWVTFIPPTGITLAEFVAAPTTYSFYYWRLEDKIGPQYQLTFVDGGTGTVELWAEAALYDYTTDDLTQQWNLKTLSATEQCGYYGTGSSSTAFDYTSEGLGDLSTLVTDMGADNADDTAAVMGTWTLSNVLIEVGWSGDTQTVFIDDVTIGGTTYNLEGTDGTSTPGTASTGNLYRSTNSGKTWSSVASPGDASNIQLVAVAPDDANFVAVVADGKEVYISEDAGAEWDDLGAITDTATLTDTKALTVSAESAGKHYIGVAGIDNASAANVFYFDVGAAVPAWVQLKVKDGFSAGDVAGAVEFSPNFASDKTMLAVTADYSESDVDYQIFSFSSKKWNSEAGHSTDFPVNLTQGAEDVDTLYSASISPDPEFLGSDDSMCIAFVGLTVDDDLDTSGIWRLDYDDVDEVKKGYEIHSVSFDGTNLVAGHYDRNIVRRSADPLATEPTVKGSATLKSPGINTAGVNEKTVVAWAGSEVVAGTSGDESAFAVSRDNGKCFNDISLIDTALSNLRDVAVSTDGSNVYLTTDDGTNMSVWRLADDDWERILTVPAKIDYIVRTAPDDIDVVYVAEKDSKNLYYSADAGEARWQTRSCKVNIQDLAVETDGEIVYAVNEDGSVSKSVNNGFTWATSVASKITGYTLISLGEDLLLAGGTTGTCSYSTDGNVTWTKLSDGMTDGNVVATATGLDDGDFVFAGLNDVAGDDIWRWEIGEDDEWGDIKSVTSTYKVYGMVLQDGLLYAVSANGTDSELYRSLVPTKDTPTTSIDTLGCTTVTFAATPSALRVTSDAELWAIATDDDKLMTYKDTIATVGPTLASPPDGYDIPVNPVSGGTSNVLLSWVCPSDRITQWDVQIAIDPGMDALTWDDVPGTAAECDEGDVVNFARLGTTFNPGTTYYWRVRVNAAGPLRSPWSETWTVTVSEAEGLPPVTVEIPPPPEVTVEVPAPEVTVTVPPMVTVPPAPAPVAPAYIWGVIIIGALLVIALIVLILRTRRVV